MEHQTKMGDELMIAQFSSLKGKKMILATSWLDRELEIGPLTIITKKKRLTCNHLRYLTDPREFAVNL